jgi:glycosyltransferase involved in cell wall biosynthesis
MTSVTVRGDQMAEELVGLCLRSKYLSRGAVASAPALIWIVEPDLKRALSFAKHCPQILDVINPGDWKTEGEQKGFQFFENFILNTDDSVEFLGPAGSNGRKCWTIPHHHCNVTNWILPAARVERPRVVGYLGQPAHLHDAEEIEAAVKKLGLEFRCFTDTDLNSYQSIDIGIAWTRRDAQRDATRSNIKFANFAAHGIPSVVCDYVSYRAVNDRLGDPAGIVAASLTDFKDGIARLVQDTELRAQMSRTVSQAQQAYSREAIGKEYLAVLAQIRP